MLLTIIPTPLIETSHDGPRQALDVIIVNDWSAAGEAVLRVRNLRLALGPLPVGESEFRVFAPEVAAPQTDACLLEVDGEIVAQTECARAPVRRWQVYLAHASHHDLGYTDLPSNLLREHAGFLDDILRYCAETDDWPEASRFRYTIEQAWSVAFWAAHRSEQQVARLVERLREGRIELTALFGNETSELCGSEEQIRLLYPAARLARHAGVRPATAELNDIPGVSWGLALALSGAGVRYFAPGIPDYFGWNQKRRYTWDEQAVMPRNLPGAFWWQGPDGERVLFWHAAPAGATLWTLAQAERDLSRQLARLEARGYPHDLIKLNFAGGERDNSPPARRLSDIARAWNERWVSPQLIVATSQMFFEAFERAAGAALPTLRGELPNTDYTIGATSTAYPLGVNRVTHDQLAAAERLATCAALHAEYIYPAALLAEAYDSMMLFDEHTWGMASPAGPAQDASANRKAGFAFHAAALAHDVLSKSANRLADAVQLEEAGYHVVVFNPLGHARTDVALTPATPFSPSGKPMYWRTTDDPLAPRVWVNGAAIGRTLVTLPEEWLVGPLEMVDVATGDATPCQSMRTDDPFAARPNAAERVALARTDPSSLSVLNYDAAQAVDLAFTVAGAPAMGYRAYRLARANGDATTSLQVGETFLENRFYRLEVDPETGSVVSLFDKELGRELVDPGAPYGFNTLLARHPHDAAGQAAIIRRVYSVERGPVLASLAWEGDAPGCPRVTGEITMYDRVKRVDIAHRVLRDATPALEHYVAFPFALTPPQFRFQAANSVIEPVRDQLPGSNTSAFTAQHWVAVNDGADEVMWTGREAPVVMLGRLWPSPVSQAHHGATPPGYDQPFLRDPAAFEHGHIYSLLMSNNFRTNFAPIQPSDVLFRFSLNSRAVSGNGMPTNATQWGDAANLPLVSAWVQGPQTGALPPESAFVELDAANVSLLALKAAEDGDGIVLRLAETAGRATNVGVTLPCNVIAEASSANLLEEYATPLTHNELTVRAPLRAFGVTTVRLRLRDVRAFPTVESFWQL